jgi:hypothetical protein
VDAFPWLLGTGIRLGEALSPIVRSPCFCVFLVGYGACVAWLRACLFLPCPAGLPRKVCSLATESLGLVGVH